MGHWVIESGFGYTQMDLRKRFSGTVPVTTDTFPLNGVLSPSAPYNGTFLGPGALLGDTPVRTTILAAQSGQHKLSRHHPLGVDGGRTERTVWIDRPNSGGQIDLPSQPILDGFSGNRLFIRHGFSPSENECRSGQ